VVGEDGDSGADLVADPVACSVADPVADAVAEPVADENEVDSSDMEVINKEDVCEAANQEKSSEIEEELIVKLDNETSVEKIIGDIKDDATLDEDDDDTTPSMEVDE